jgi:hypothetical protein
VARRADRALVMTDGKIVRRLASDELETLAGIADVSPAAT